MGYFKRTNYPDGQVGCEFVDGRLETYPEYIVKERINSYKDLFYVRAMADIIQHNGLRGWELFIPCLFGQRSDRRFNKDGKSSFDLKLIAEVINSCGFEKVTIFDPHSDMALGLINHSFKLSSFNYVHETVTKIRALGTGNELVLVSPDAGAYKKVFEYGVTLNTPVVSAAKHRDVAGVIDLKFQGDVKGKDCLIVDDLCDGGYTFIVLADALKKQGAANVFLYVSHGLFTKGFEELKKDIVHIYTTNSIRDGYVEGWSDHGTVPKNDYVTQFKVI